MCESDVDNRTKRGEPAGYELEKNWGLGGGGGGTGGKKQLHKSS